MSNSEQIVPGVDVASFGYAKGVWVSDGDKTIGLVEQKDVGGYLVIYKDIHKNGLPLAVTFDGVQLPREKGSDAYRFIDWNTLYEMVEAFKAFRSAK